DFPVASAAPKPHEPQQFPPPAFPLRQNMRRQFHPTLVRVPPRFEPLPAFQILVCTPLLPPERAAHLPKVPAPLPPPRDPSSAAPATPAARVSGFALANPELSFVAQALLLAL